MSVLEGVDCTKLICKITNRFFKPRTWGSQAKTLCSFMDKFSLFFCETCGKLKYCILVFPAYLPKPLQKSKSSNLRTLPLALFCRNTVLDWHMNFSTGDPKMKALGGGSGNVSSCLPCHLVWFSLKLSDKPINPIEKKLIKITSQ